MPTSRPVAFVAFPDLQLLDLAGPLEVFDAANRIADDELYATVVATPGGRRIRSSSRVEISADRAIAELADDELHTLMVLGGTGTRALIGDAVALGDIARAAEAADRVTSVCTGALVLAAAGLLHGYEATTHWRYCDTLAGYHGVEVQPDRIFVRDRDRWTSAGVTAGIDLALALVETDHGPELAHEVASWLVVFARRPGGQAQFSATLAAQAARTPAIAELQRWLPDHLDEDLTVDRLAERAGMSARHFTRTFRTETGTTPAAHVESLRVEAARRLFETTDLTVSAIAHRVGMGHAETLHRSFIRRVGTTPARYRQHFTHRTA